jgi:ATP-dependent RNA circularization protein (DNA/RNA ligase family)
LTEQPGARAALTDEFLEQIRGAFEEYTETGDVFARARLVREIGKSYAPELLAEVDRLRAENHQLRAALRPMIQLVQTLAELEAAELMQAQIEHEAIQHAMRLGGELLGTGDERTR